MNDKTVETGSVHLPKTLKGKMYGPPVDLSFRNISDIGDALSDVPHRSLRPAEVDSEGRFKSRSFRLSNNNIKELAGLQSTLHHFLAEPSMLGWLDLSFNKLTCIDSALCELRELRVLYLHSNAIHNLFEVDKLEKLQHLYAITLHGNAIEIMKGYRQHVIAVLPHLKTMDFSSVTPEERMLAKPALPAPPLTWKKSK